MKRAVVGFSVSAVAFVQSGDPRFAALAVACALLIALWPVPWLEETPMTEPAIEMNFDLDIALAEEGIQNAPPIEDEVTCLSTWHLFAHRLATRCPDCGGSPNIKGIPVRSTAPHSGANL